MFRLVRAMNSQSDNDERKERKRNRQRNILSISNKFSVFAVCKKKTSWRRVWRAIFFFSFVRFPIRPYEIANCDHAHESKVKEEPHWFPVHVLLHRIYILTKLSQFVTCRQVQNNKSIKYIFKKPSIVWNSWFIRCNWENLCFVSLQTEILAIALHAEWHVKESVVYESTPVQRWQCLQ